MRGRRLSSSPREPSDLYQNRGQCDVLGRRCRIERCQGPCRSLFCTMVIMTSARAISQRFERIKMRKSCNLSNRNAIYGTRALHTLIVRELSVLPLK